MKKKLLYLSFLVSSLSFSQITIYEDSFETYPDFIISGITNGTNTWEVLDLDLLNTYTGGADPATWANANSPMAFQIFNPTTASVTNSTTGVNGATENANFDPRTGSKYVAFWGGVPNSNGQTATANNDWLISPVIDLSTASGSSLSVWLKSLSDSYGLEKYRVGVYTGTGVPSQSTDFTIISGPTNLSAPYTNWFEYTASLAAYDGQNIRIGIQCLSADVYMLKVDDFKITATTLNTQSFLAATFDVFPNPTNNTLLISNDKNISFDNLTLTDINGRTVKSMNFNTVSEFNLNVSDLTSGIYFLKIKTSEGTLDKKIIKN